MNSIDKLLKKMRRLWMVEHFARQVALLVGVSANGVLLCLLLNRLAGLPLWSMAIVGSIGAVCVAACVVFARAKAPQKESLARLLDERAGSRDLFSSALEFAGRSDRFGWLGDLTCDKAHSDAVRVALKARWSLGGRRQWAGLASAAAVLLVGITAATAFQSPPAAVDQSPVAAVEPTRAPYATPRPTEAAAVPTPPAEPIAPLPDIPDIEPPKPDDTVQITSDMYDRNMAAVPEEIDLTGVTPIRWDDKEISGSGTKDQGKDADKIDPVKLDAALLKDLQVAKKEKQEGSGGEKGGVDIAVMGEEKGLKAKGDKGGKEKGSGLADAVSKDPRGEAHRMAMRLPKKGLPILSINRLPTRTKGEERPMLMLDFLASLDKLRKAPAMPLDNTAPAGATSADNIVAQEQNPEPARAAIVGAYFDKLQKADK